MTSLPNLIMEVEVLQDQHRTKLTNLEAVEVKVVVQVQRKSQQRKTTIGLRHLSHVSIDKLQILARLYLQPTRLGAHVTMHSLRNLDQLISRFQPSNRHTTNICSWQIQLVCQKDMLH